MPEHISSHANPLIKLIRHIRQKKGREETGLFLVEGISPVGEAVEAGWVVEALIYSPDLLTSEYAQCLVEEQDLQGVHCITLPSKLFASLAEKENPQGIIAVIHQRDIKLETIAPDQICLGAAVVSPQDPGNVGTILRTLDAVGADGLFILDGGVELYHPSVVRASMGTLFWKPVIRASFEDFLSWTRKKGYQLIGSSAHATLDYREFRMGDQPTILVLGNEQKGLSVEQTAACDTVISIPMKGRVSSLNLAISAGILLYHLVENK